MGRRLSLVWLGQAPLLARCWTAAAAMTMRPAALCQVRHPASLGLLLGKFVLQRFPTLYFVTFFLTKKNSLDLSVHPKYPGSDHQPSCSKFL